MITIFSIFAEVIYGVPLQTFHEVSNDSYEMHDAIILKIAEISLCL